MAGKTFPGIGDLEDESAPLEPVDAADGDSDAQFYSGPTVVDEAKVEQGLKKLRSLDAPPGPLTGIHRVVDDDGLTDPRLTPQVTLPGTLMMPDLTIDPARGTAVGRSVSGPVAGQQTTQPFDDRALRGTMFGHSVHVPDLDRPARTHEVETSKALAIVERGVPTTNEIAIFQPGPGYAPHQASIPLGQEPHPRASRYQVRETPIDMRAVSPHKKLVFRVAAATACIGAIVVAALLWVRSTSEEAEASFRANAALHTPRPERPSETAPLPPQAATPPSAEVTTPHPPALAPAPPAPARAADDTLRPVAAPAATSPAATPDRRAHASATRSERRHAASPRADGHKLDKGDKPGETDAPAKPTRSKRPVEDDPDATMAPTIE